MQEIKNKHKSICNGNSKPDLELRAWEKWIQIRKEETEHLAKKTGRPPIDLLMNALEKVREDRERKIVFENAQIEKKITIRNNVIWENPARLSQICPCEAVYEVQRTRSELGKPSVIERVGVPKIIQEAEKGLTGTSKKQPFLKLDADFLHYRKKRENELKNKIKKLDPYRPEVNSLIVIGTKSGLLKKVRSTVPVLKLEAHISSNVCEESDLYAVQINKSIYYKSIQGVRLKNIVYNQKESTSSLKSSWTYYFNTSINKMGRAMLFLKNLGTVSLRYSWKKIIKSVQFIPETVNEPVFFFNKNDDIICPGQEKNILFIFLSSKANTFKESWELKFNNVSFLDTHDNKFEIDLTADACENFDTNKRKSNKIRIEIEHEALRTMIKLLLEEIIIKSIHIEHHIYPYKDKLLEAEIFEMKNPEHFYHETNVMKLKQLYTDISSSKWKLSIKELKQKIMKLEYDDRMKYYELLKQSNRELLRPWRESQDILQQKYKAVNVILCRLADKFNEEYKYLLKKYDSEDNVNRDHHHLFYLRMYSHICTTVETCAGIIGSIDLNRWIGFDFCSK